MPSSICANSSSARHGAVLHLLESSRVAAIRDRRRECILRQRRTADVSSDEWKWMDYPGSNAPAAAFASALRAQSATCRLETMARSSQLRAACRSRSTLLGICRNRGFPDHSGGRAGIRYSQCLRQESRRRCSSASTATRTLSSSRAAAALSLISKLISPLPEPSGVKPVTKDLVHYHQLERRLWLTRWSHAGQESVEEDGILDEMETVWMNLIEDERALLRLEGPRCWPMDSSSLTPDLTDARHASAPTPWAYEGFHSAAEAILSSEAA
jgi:hypothetical protein